MVDGSCAALRRVGRGLARLPLARRRRGVVEADVLDRELADLAAGLLEGELLAVDDGLATAAASRPAAGRLE